jgi:hypothetical protein
MTLLQAETPIGCFRRVAANPTVNWQRPISGNVFSSCLVLNEPRLRPQNIADLFDPCAKEIVDQMSVARRGLNLLVP